MLISSSLILIEDEEDYRVTIEFDNEKGVRLVVYNKAIDTGEEVIIHTWNLENPEIIEKYLSNIEYLTLITRK